jgi:hypothetical protein
VRFAYVVSIEGQNLRERLRRHLSTRRLFRCTTVAGVGGSPLHVSEGEAVDPPAIPDLAALDVALHQCRCFVTAFLRATCNELATAAERYADLGLADGTRTNGSRAADAIPRVGALAFGAVYPWAYWPLAALLLAAGLAALWSPSAPESTDGAASEAALPGIESSPCKLCRCPT